MNSSEKFLAEREHGALRELDLKLIQPHQEDGRTAARRVTARGIKAQDEQFCIN